jgi:hypothetical protein
MQFCTVSVAIRGSANHVVTNKEVTVPEIKVLQHLHGGNDTVRDIRPLRFEKEFSHDEERQRLRNLYERGNGNGDEVHGLIGRLFGPFGKLPTTLAAIGYDPRQLAAAKRAAAEQALEDAKAIENAENGDDDLTDDERAAIEAMNRRESDDETPGTNDDEGGDEDDLGLS